MAPRKGDERKIKDKDFWLQNLAWSLSLSQVGGLQIPKKAEFYFYSFIHACICSLIHPPTQLLFIHFASGWLCLYSSMSILTRFKNYYRHFISKLVIFQLPLCTLLYLPLENFVTFPKINFPLPHEK